METKNVEKRLGKGLEALISSDAGKPKERVERAEIKNVVPNPFQPRKKFSEGKMEVALHWAVTRSGRPVTDRVTASEKPFSPMTLTV